MIDLASWQAQLRKGVAEMVILSLLEKGERYGLDILKEISSDVGVLAEGTLYPLLARLERDGKIVGSWVLSLPARNPRKYYRLSTDGRALLAEMKATWGGFAVFVTDIVERPSAEPAMKEMREHD